MRFGAENPEASSGKTFLEPRQSAWIQDQLVQHNDYFGQQWAGGTEVIPNQFFRILILDTSEGVRHYLVRVPIARRLTTRPPLQGEKTLGTHPPG